jgi:hypothetical protein
MRLLICFLIVSCGANRLAHEDASTQGDCPLYVNSEGQSLVEQVNTQNSSLYSQEEKVDELNLRLDQLIASVEAETP